MWTFVKWLENLLEADEMQERLASFEQYIQQLTALATKYNSSIGSAYLAHEKHVFITSSIEAIRDWMANLPKELAQREQEFIRNKRDKEREERVRRESYKGYHRADNQYERIICSRTDPQAQVKGMEAYPMTEIDQKLKGFYGVHVGSSRWLGILKRDGYCESGDAYIYVIHADEMNADGIFIYEMDDPHIAYRDDATPDSKVIFSKKKIIPAKYIELDKVIPEDEIEEAPPPYGME